MRAFWTVVSVIGLGVIAVGLLWFLQGSDLVHIDPIACTGKCEPVRGHQPGWQVAGTAAVAIGLVALTTGWRKVRR